MGADAPGAGPAITGVDSAVQLGHGGPQGLALAEGTRVIDDHDQVFTGHAFDEADGAEGGQAAGFAQCAEGKLRVLADLFDKRQDLVGQAGGGLWLDCFGDVAHESYSGDGGCG